LMGAESAGGSLVLRDLVPVIRVLEPVDPRRMNEFFPMDRQHEHPWERAERTRVVASYGEAKVPPTPKAKAEPARAGFERGNTPMAPLRSCEPQPGDVKTIVIEASPPPHGGPCKENLVTPSTRIESAAFPCAPVPLLDRVELHLDAAGLF